MYAVNYSFNRGCRVKIDLRYAQQGIVKAR